VSDAVIQMPMAEAPAAEAPKVGPQYRPFALDVIEREGLHSVLKARDDATVRVREAVAAIVQRRGADPRVVDLRILSPEHGLCVLEPRPEARP
jgi:hypothetical protein